MSRTGSVIQHGLIISIFLLITALLVGCSHQNSPLTPSSDLDNSLTVSSQISQAGQSTRGSDFIDNEVLVILDEANSAPNTLSILNEWQLRLKRKVGLSWADLYVLEITDETSVRDMVERLRADPNVLIAEPNGIVQAFETPYWPDDPLWESSDEGNDPRDSVFDQWGPAKIGADIVWNEETGSEDVVVAILDSGMLFEHEDLNGRLWYNEDEIPDNQIDDDENGWVDDWWGWDTIEIDNDPADDPDWMVSYHGTSCAGVVAAEQDNGKGLSGVAPGVKIMVVRCLGYFGGTWEAIAEAIDYASVNGADIISMSLGGTEYSGILKAACDNAWDDGNGSIVIAAAGNDGDDPPAWPAAYDSVLAVGAVTTFDGENEPIDEQRLTWYLGYDWASNFGSGLDVMGYGSKYITTYGSHYESYRDGLEADFFGGTSCACPMSAGVLALMESYYPGESNQWYVDRLKETADDLHEPGFDIESGYGRVNALRAIFGPDRYAEDEDPDGFVDIDPSNTSIFDSIHDVPGGQFYDLEDFYKFTAITNGWLDIHLDIYTYGETLDIEIFADPQMTEKIIDATGENHWDSSFEIIGLNVESGEDYYMRIYSPDAGNSTTYGLTIDQGINELKITGENIAPPFVHHAGFNIPFIKLTLDITYHATLNEIIVNRSGSLPNDNWAIARLYRDSNLNNILDDEDELISDEAPPITNRIRFENAGIKWTSEQALVLFVTAGVTETPVDNTIRMSLESYKDVSTKEHIEAHYTDFPISSGTIQIGTDTEPPVWQSTTGIQSCDPGQFSAALGWNAAIDDLSPPVRYNVYHTDELPFVLQHATHLTDVVVTQGTTTDFETTVFYLPNDVERYFIVRAEDQAGNEEDNIVILSCTPSGKDPANPEVLYSIGTLMMPSDLAIKNDIVLVTDGYGGLNVFDISDPVHPSMISQWYEDFAVGTVAYNGAFAYTGGGGNFSVINLIDPEHPLTTDSVPFLTSTSIDFDPTSGWAYCTNYYNSLIAVNIRNPFDITASPEFTLPSGGIPNDLTIYGDYLYIPKLMNGVLVYDKTDPSHPILLDSFDTPAVKGMTIDGNVLCTVESNSGNFTTYDINSDPVLPPILDQTNEGSGIDCTSVVILGDFAYVARFDYGLAVFDISDPENIIFNGEMEFSGIVDMVTNGTYIYLVRDIGFTESPLYVVL